MEQEIQSCKQFFQSHNITISGFWLESCLGWFHEENPNTREPLDTLRLKVYAQWLLLDLREVEIPILPPNLSLQKKIILNGIYSLQMLQIMDISTSKYLQMQKIRNSKGLSNLMVDEQYRDQSELRNNTTKRLLQLLLTDGVQEIKAIEYKPVKSLHFNLPPGTKIKIIGPITARRGQLLLEEKNVHILGGEIEELLIENAVENVLARALKLPENPNPKVIEENSVNIVDEFESVLVHHESNSTNNVNNVQIRNNASSAFSDVSNTNRQVKHNSNLVPNLLDNDEEIDMLITVEEEIRQSNLRDGSNNTNIPDLKTVNKGDASSRNSLELDIYKEFQNTDIDLDLALLDDQLSQEQNPIISIEDVLKKKDHLIEIKYTIKAKYKSVLEKISVTNDKWHLKLLIEDETGSIETYIHTDIISNFTGFSPSALISMKHNVLEKDEQATATVIKV